MSALDKIDPALINMGMADASFESDTKIIIYIQPGADPDLSSTSYIAKCPAFISEL